MIMPTKIIKPVDSLISISATVLRVLSLNSLSLDSLHEEINKIYPKEISIEKLIFCLNFLYIINKVEDNNEVIKIKL